MLAALLQAPAPLGNNLVTPADVGGPAAWQALCLDGHLQPVWGGCALPAGIELAREHRAEALRPFLQPRTVVGRQSALWVLTGLRMSKFVHLLYSPSQHRPPPQPMCLTHQTNLQPDDQVEISGVPVTAATRTAVDLAIHLDRRAALQGLRELNRLGLISLEPVLARLDQIPGRSRRAESTDVVHWAIPSTTNASPTAMTSATKTAATTTSGSRSSGPTASHPTSNP